ncbi:MAG: SBBP repeat-containing protein, partial [Promethearchaeota archaeon]
MTLKNTKTPKAVLTVLKIFILIFLFINFNFTYTGPIESESLENTTKPQLYTSNSIQYQLEWYRLWGDSRTQGGFGLTIDSNYNIYQAAYTSDGPYGSNDAILIKSTFSGDHVWSRTWGGSGDDVASAVAVDSLSNIYLTGSKDIPNDVIFLVKYDVLGNKIWQRTWNGVSDVQSRGIAIDSHNDIYIVGYGGGNMVLIKYNRYGAVIWERNWVFSRGYDIRIDSQDNVYVTGATRSFTDGSNDMFLVKYNSLGTQLWKRTWGGIDSDISYSITIDPEDNIYIGGTTESYGTIGVSNIALLKYDGSGNLIWNSTYMKGGCKSIDIDSYGNITVTGIVYIDGDSYIYVGTYNSFGQPTWNTTW